MGNHVEREKYRAAQITQGRLKKIIEGTKGLPKAFKLFFAHHLRHGTYYGKLQERNALIADCCEAWKDLKTPKRQAIIGQLFPNISSEVEAAVAVAGRAAYQSGYQRRPFRCPRAKTQIATMECGWLLEAATVWGDYDHDAPWFARHSSFFAWSTTSPLIAGVLDQGGQPAEQLLQLVDEIAAGEHEYETLDRSILKGCLSSENPDAWAFVTRLLLAAQRQEGLRQSILESVDEAHPGAFDAVISLILKENLGRFSSVVRAVDVWFGFLWDQETKFKVDPVLKRVQPLLQDDDARLAALESESAEDVYLALWCTAYHDIDLAIERAALVLERTDPEQRYAALHLLAQSTWSGAGSLIESALGDPDLRVALYATTTLHSRDKKEGRDQVFDALEALLERLDPKTKEIKLSACIWPWTARMFPRSDVITALMNFASQERMLRLIPVIPDLEPYERAGALRRLANMSERWVQPERGPGRLESPTYELALLLLGDPSTEVRSTALKALSNTPLLKEEAERHVELLRRKSSDVRTNALARLGTLPDASLVEVAQQLMEDGLKERRVAGLELAREAVTQGRCAEAMGALAESYVERRKALSDVEESHLEVLRGSAETEITLKDALGLVDPSALMTWPRPAAPKMPAAPKELPHLLNKLCGELLARTEEERRGSAEDPEGAEVRLEPVPMAFPGDRSVADELAWIESRWKPWFEEHCGELEDRGGAVWVYASVFNVNFEKVGPHGKAIADSRDRWNHSPLRHAAQRLIGWMLSWSAPSGALDLALDAADASFSAATEEELRLCRRADTMQDWHGYGDDPRDPKVVPATKKAKMIRAAYFNVRSLQIWLPDQQTPEHDRRIYRGLAYLNEQVYPHHSGATDLNLFLNAYSAGLFEDGDAQSEFIYQLCGEKSVPGPYGQRRGMSLHDVTWNGPVGKRREHQPSWSPPLKDFPELEAARDRVIQRILEVECARGDIATAATPFVSQLGRLHGLEPLASAVNALGKLPLERSAAHGYSMSDSRKSTLSLVVRSTAPREDEDPVAFNAWAKDIPEKRLIELSAYVPQWAPFIEGALGWKGLTDAVWWLRAHTKETIYASDSVTEAWEAEVSERTPLSMQALSEGAVDVDWFGAARKRLTKKRWDALFECARYASSSSGHKRAELFSDAMTGSLKAAAVLERVAKKRHQDSVRALGLIPLRKGKLRQGDLLKRYERLAAFRKESKKFGSQRQENEGRAVEIGMQNLARTAGFSDPQRLAWAMEQEAVKDLAEGPVTVSRDDVSVSLSVSDEGQPVLEIQRGTRSLKNVPKALAKDPGVVALKARAKDLRTQASRVKEVLEAALVSRSLFEGHELTGLMAHPILGPSLGRVVFIEEAGAAIGYVSRDGQNLLSPGGETSPLDPEASYALAHPHDLLATGHWHAWQKECFDAARVQPIKQIFRELYPITAEEATNGKRSRRYAGHQVNPRQGVALLGKRGWVLRPGDGISKTYHSADLVAWLFAEESFYTPADIEGLTLNQVHFTRRGEFKPLPLEEVPPHLFSETMRDLDLVVSVAHQGGVDPEASASTIEMRAALMREACRLLQLDNVEVKEAHAVISGERAKYSIHLGSAQARVVGSIALAIVAVHSQHRGRVFLPFADDDPRTAEVLSKTLMLARDKEIQDPSILEQIQSS